MPVSLRALARADLAGVELVELVRATVVDDGATLRSSRPSHRRRRQVVPRLDQRIGRARPVREWQQVASRSRRSSRPMRSAALPSSLAAPSTPSRRPAHRRPGRRPCAPARPADPPARRLCPPRRCWRLARCRGQGPAVRQVRCCPSVGLDFRFDDRERRVVSAAHLPDPVPCRAAAHEPRTRPVLTDCAQRGVAPGVLPRLSAVV